MQQWFTIYKLHCAWYYKDHLHGYKHNKHWLISTDRYCILMHYNLNSHFAMPVDFDVVVISVAMNEGVEAVHQPLDSL